MSESRPGSELGDEGELERMQLQIWELLMAEGATDHMTAIDSEAGQVLVVVPLGYQPASEELRGLLAAPSVRVTEVEGPICMPQGDSN